MIRPSYVLGGRAMEIVHDAAGLNRYMRHAVSVSGTSPVLIDRYLQDAIEVDVDAVADGRRVDDRRHHGAYRGGRDSFRATAPARCRPTACGPATIAEIERQTVALARALGVVGLMNVQFAVKDGDDLRARGQSARLAHRAVRRQGDRRADRQDRGAGRWPASRSPTSSAAPRRGDAGHVAVKEAVFPFARFPGVDLILGPEMKSTGEVMGLDGDFGRAFAKSQLGSGTSLPLEGCVFVSVRDRDKAALVEPCRRLVEMGFRAGRDAGHRRRAVARRGCR